MLKLHARLAQSWDAEPFTARISTSYGLPEPSRDRQALLVDTDHELLPPGFRAYFKRPESLVLNTPAGQPHSAVITLPPALGYLADGDIVRVSPRNAELWVMYRRESRFNSLLLTEQCNSDCIMCSQP